MHTPHNNKRPHTKRMAHNLFVSRESNRQDSRMTRRIPRCCGVVLLRRNCSSSSRNLILFRGVRLLLLLLLLLLLGGSFSSAWMGSSSSSSSLSRIGKQKHSNISKNPQEQSPFQHNRQKTTTTTPPTHHSVTPTDDDSFSSSTSSWMGGVSSGRTLLLGVALLYGTLNVSLKLVYEASTTPSLPPSAASLSAVRGWLAVLGFAGVSLWNSSRSAATTTDKRNPGNGDDTITTRATTADAILSPPQSSSSSSSLALFRDGTELAVWNGLAQGLLNAGLLTVGSARASFLTQTSVIWTPLLTTLLLLLGPAGIVLARSSSSSSSAALSTAKIPSATTWIGCGIALSGLFRLSGIMGSTTTGAGGGWGMLTLGDGLVIGGALAWSAYLYRLEQIGSRHTNNEIALQGCKTTVLAILYSIWWIVSSTLMMNHGTAVGGGLSSLSSSMAWLVGPGALVAWAALTYSAWGPGILADIWQQQGQRTVSASETNVLLSLEPVFAALCGRLFLGETLTGPEYQGGALIVLAALVTSVTNKNGNDGDSNGDYRDEKIHEAE